MTQKSNDQSNGEQHGSAHEHGNAFVAGSDSTVDAASENSGHAVDAAHASRRRFVKGAAIAAPAIMTLRGGQALAQQSLGLSACVAERSEMGQVAQNAMGDELYFVVDVDSSGRRTVTAASKDTVGAQTVTASCMASLI